MDWAPAWELKCRGSIPSQGTCLGCGPSPRWGVHERQPHTDVSFPSVSLPSLSLKINKIFFLKKNLSVEHSARYSKVKTHLFLWDISGRTMSPWAPEWVWGVREGKWSSMSPTAVLPWPVGACWAQPWVPFLTASSDQGLPGHCYPSASVTPSLTHDPSGHMRFTKKVRNVLWSY